MSESVYEYFEVYPEDPRSGFDIFDKPMWHPLYFVELHRWEKGAKMKWRLFKKNFIITREEWNKKLMENPDGLHLSTRLGVEGHPYQLSCGEVCEYPGAVSMETVEFLKFMVDAMNEKARMDEMPLEMATDTILRSKTTLPNHDMGGQISP